MTKYLVVLVLTAAIGLTSALNYQKQQTLKAERIFILECRIGKINSKIWAIKTQLEFPGFPPSVGIKMSNKTSMKYTTKGQIND